MSRNWPNQAVAEFPEWLRIGDELFSYTIDTSIAIDEDVPVNEPCPIDPALLEIRPEDFVVPVAHDEAPEIYKPMENGFSMDDVEYDEWPEFPLFTKVFSFARSNNFSSCPVCHNGRS